VSLYLAGASSYCLMNTQHRHMCMTLEGNSTCCRKCYRQSH